MACEMQNHTKKTARGSPAGHPVAMAPASLPRLQGARWVEPRREPGGDHSRLGVAAVGIKRQVSSDGFNRSPGKGPSVAGSGSLHPTWCREGSEQGATSTQRNHTYVSSNGAGGPVGAGWVGANGIGAAGVARPERTDPPRPSPTSFTGALPRRPVTRPSLRPFPGAPHCWLPGTVPARSASLGPVLGERPHRACPAQQLGHGADRETKGRHSGCRQLECLLDFSWAARCSLSTQADPVSHGLPVCHRVPPFSIAVPAATLDRGPAHGAPFARLPYERLPEAAASAAALRFWRFPRGSAMNLGSRAVPDCSWRSLRNGCVVLTACWPSDPCCPGSVLFLIGHCRSPSNPGQVCPIRRLPSPGIQCSWLLTPRPPRCEHQQGQGPIARRTPQTGPRDRWPGRPGSPASVQTVTAVVLGALPITRQGLFSRPVGQIPAQPQ